MEKMKKEEEEEEEEEGEGELSSLTSTMAKEWIQIFLNWNLKGIVSRDFEGLQMILMDRIGVPDVPLEVYSFLNLHLHIAF